MDPLVLGLIVAIATILVLFSGLSVAVGLLIVSGGFLIVFGKLDNFALLSIPMFIIMRPPSPRPGPGRISTRRWSGG